MKPIPPNERLVPVYVGEELILVSPPEYYRDYPKLIRALGGEALNGSHADM